MRSKELSWVLALVLSPGAVACGGDDDDDAMGAAGTPGAAGENAASGGTPSGAGSSGGPSASSCEKPEAGEPIVWIDTGEIEHDKDYHSFESFVNEAVPTDWTCPVNYADGTYTLEVEVVELSNPEAQPVFYTVGWKRPEETPRQDDAEYIRTAVKIDGGEGLYEAEGPIKKLQQVINGKDAGPIGNAWDWTSAWRRPNGDAFDIGPEELYPLTVRVTLTLYPASP